MGKIQPLIKTPVTPVTSVTNKKNYYYSFIYILYFVTGRHFQICDTYDRFW